jgi:hypothetical protein
MKKIISMAMVLALIFACSATAFATSYSSTISMSAHSTLAGATRSYVGTSHQISLKLSSKDEAGDNYCKVTLNRVNLSSTDAKKTAELNLKTVGNTYGFKTSNQTDGKFNYYFNSYYTAITTAWTSKSVTMSSK